MTAQHFKELVETIQTTKAITENELGRAIGTSGVSIRRWKTWGVPTQHASMICARLRAFMRGEAVC
jgi:response regulator of citrate/malate metabolism